eukprot:2047763-Rhodomonas_salina.1
MPVAMSCMQMGVKLGKECGYTIQFDNKADVNCTRVKFCTDGILLQVSEHPACQCRSFSLADLLT